LFFFQSAGDLRLNAGFYDGQDGEKLKSRTGGRVQIKHVHLFSASLCDDWVSSFVFSEMLFPSLPHRLQGDPWFGAEIYGYGKYFNYHQ